MDINRARKKDKKREDPDFGVIKMMFSLRFKLLAFMNTVHDLICNQVEKKVQIFCCNSFYKNNFYINRFTNQLTSF
jgi:hypothetical protein